MRNPQWTTVEDEVIRDYVMSNIHLTNVEITKIIEQDRPIEINHVRYEGKSLYQHVCEIKRKLKGVA